MGRLLSLLLLIYVIGIGVQLAPTVEAAWDTDTASEVSAKVMDELPSAARWPVRMFDRLRDKDVPEEPKRDSYGG